MMYTKVSYFDHLLKKILSRTVIKYTKANYIQMAFIAGEQFPYNV